MADLKGIWLEVSNVRFNPDDGVQVKLKGDKADETEWWPVHPKAAGGKVDDTRREVFAGLDKKRVVLAKLVPNSEMQLFCSQIRIQHAESGIR